MHPTNGQDLGWQRPPDHASKRNTGTTRNTFPFAIPRCNTSRHQNSFVPKFTRQEEAKSSKPSNLEHEHKRNNKNTYNKAKNSLPNMWKKLHSAQNAPTSARKKQQRPDWDTLQHAPRLQQQLWACHDQENTHSTITPQHSFISYNTTTTYYLLSS